jgi:hypothetical protein
MAGIERRIGATAGALAALVAAASCNLVLGLKQGVVDRPGSGGAGGGATGASSSQVSTASSSSTASGTGTGGAGGGAPQVCPMPAVWTKRTPAHAPSNRSSVGLAYDEKRQLVVLYGGCIASGNGAIGDTWEWNGSDWTQNTSGVGADASCGPAMAYDSVRELTVLFGGSTNPNGGCGNASSDTWEYNAKNWAKPFSIIQPPPAAVGAQMAYDKARQRMVMLGGNGTMCKPQNVTSEYGGTDWSSQTVGAMPAGRVGMAVTFDAKRAVTLAFGGSDGAGTYNDLWAWDGVAWKELKPSSPPKPSYAQAAYNAECDETIVYTEADGTWRWNGAAWTQVVVPAASPGVDPASPGAARMVYDAARRRMVMVTLDKNKQLETWLYGGD